MTICIGIKVNDGVVFVADSATTLLSPYGDGSQFGVRVYNHADKVFNLYRGQPIVSMTCGLGNFGNESIATISKCIRDKLMSEDSGIDPMDYTIQSIAEFAYQEFKRRYDPLDATIKTHSSFEYFIAGFPTNSNRSEIWKIVFSNGETPEPVMLVNSDNSDIIWAGQPEACIRLILGVSSQTRFVLQSTGLSEEQSEQLQQSIMSASLSPFLVPSMPMPDAISLAEFLASTTVNFVKFMPGADTVGGSLDIATITKYEGFKWIKRKHFYPTHLNGDTDHVR